MFYVYILASTTSGAYYIGYTSDLWQRVATHQKNEGRWTKNKGPWELKYYEAFKVDTEARKRELQLKKGKNKSYITWLIAHGPGHSIG
ncbi:GIY-YIG nuclease family protein [Neolewinella aquimaris]|uniref:GIY-YIG nuclease family protein n=1 Tax=Neolewinella aquimaris TaxID=1835722 RepID=UPI00161B644D|nr:GIY-YIG nuclease family protein [Neolewinella aquimaris]